MLESVDTKRRIASSALDQERRSELGQYLTSPGIARFMASTFNSVQGEVSLLDAGAGIGSLTAAFLDRVLSEKDDDSTVESTTFEIDATMIGYLRETLSSYEDSFRLQGKDLATNLCAFDFIETASLDVFDPKRRYYTHAILNPPYKKISNQSKHRAFLRLAKIETVNLYSGFVGLALLHLQIGGELVAIIPRSFCSGNYYKPFRRLITRKAAIRQIHLFDSRNDAFRDDAVLQENVIIHLVKGQAQGPVKISRSADGSFNDYSTSEFHWDHIVKPDDEEVYFHIPSVDADALNTSPNIVHSLEDIGVMVSTGPVVDFRVKDFLSMDTPEHYAPLIYPVHFNGKHVDWPKESKKPNSIAINEETSKMLFPIGYYVVIRRFSSKEEKQRIVARVITPEHLPSGEFGIENHLNVLHNKKKGIPMHLAYGLAAYLNSSFVDLNFRSFNGHTQVNATDLKQMRYPSKLVLEKLGIWAVTLDHFSPQTVDQKVREIL
jgi:adenine-specific DNA-methyltransferase